jgi:cytochrome c-type biogenesis protein CcmH/NrfG
MNLKNCVYKQAVETGRRVLVIVAAAAVLTLPLYSQQTANDAQVANQQAATANPRTQQEIIEELDAMKKRI